MGDRIAVLKGGLLQQVGTPREMYDAPANVFVAGFIGSPAMNIATFKVDHGIAHVGAAKVPLERSVVEQLTDADGGKITIGFRPEALEVVSGTTENAMPVSVNLVEELGSDAFVYGTLVGPAAEEAEVRSGAGDDQVIVRIDPRNVPMKGDTIHVTIKPGQSHLFSAATGNRLN